MNENKEQALYEQYKAELDKLDATKDQWEATIREKYAEQRADFETKLEELKEATEENSEEVSARVQAAWQALKDSINR